jgi:hypothetical protein
MVPDILRDKSAFIMILGNVRKNSSYGTASHPKRNGILSNNVVRISTLIKPTAFDFKLPHKFGLFNI